MCILSAGPSLEGATRLRGICIAFNPVSCSFVAFSPVALLFRSPLVLHPVSWMLHCMCCSHLLTVGVGPRDKPNRPTRTLCSQPPPLPASSQPIQEPPERPREPSRGVEEPPRDSKIPPRASKMRPRCVQEPPKGDFGPQLAPRSCPRTLKLM